MTLVVRLVLSWNCFFYYMGGALLKVRTSRTKSIFAIFHYSHFYRKRWNGFSSSFLNCKTFFGCRRARNVWPRLVPGSGGGWIPGRALGKRPRGALRFFAEQAGLGASHWACASGFLAWALGLWSREVRARNFIWSAEGAHWGVGVGEILALGTSICQGQGLRSVL